MKSGEWSAPILVLMLMFQGQRKRSYFPELNLDGISKRELSHFFFHEYLLSIYHVRNRKQNEGPSFYGAFIDLPQIYW